MGYTHYFELEETINEETWKSILMDVKSAALASYPLVQYEWDDKAAPQFDTKGIRFNGVGELGHETFVLRPDDVSWAFCKTARKPYDVLVVATLIIVKHHCETFSWSSDGEVEDFEDALELLQSVGLDYALHI